MGKAAYAFSLALISGLTFGCTQSGSQIDYADFDPSYNSQNFGNYHKDRDTRVVIIGSTLGEAPAVFGRMVTDAMQGQNRGGRTNFTTIPGASAEDNLRVVMAFDVASYGNSICDGHIPKPVKTPGVTTVQGAWCWGQPRTILCLGAHQGDERGKPGIPPPHRRCDTRNVPPEPAAQT